MMKNSPPVLENQTRRKINTHNIFIEKSSVPLMTRSMVMILESSVPLIVIPIFDLRKPFKEKKNIYIFIIISASDDKIYRRKIRETISASDDEKLATCFEKKTGRKI